MKNNNIKKYILRGIFVVLLLLITVITITVIKNSSQITDADTVTVTFDSQGGSKVDAITIKKGEKISDLPQSYLLGSSFNGWYTDENIENEFNVDSKIDKDITLYAGYTDTIIDINDFKENAIYEEDCDENVKISFICNKKLSSEQFLSSINIEALSGYLPEEFDVKISGNEYILSAIDGYSSGKLYKITIPNWIKFKDFDENIKEYSFRIHKELSEVVEMNEDIKYVLLSDLSSYSDKDETNKTYQIIISKNKQKEYKFQNEDIVCLGNEKKYNADESIFIKVTDVINVGENYYIKAIDAEIEEVFNDLDIFFEQNISASDIIKQLDTKEIEKEIYESESDKKVTKLMSGLISSNGTFQRKLSASPDFTSNTYMLEDTVKTLIEQELTEGAEISIKVGTGHNSNFDKAYTDEFVALSIKFSFETDIKEIIQIKAEFELTQYLAVSAQGSLDYERKFITIKWADFDVAMNLYSQTDIKLSVLICSAEDDDYTDITEEIKEKLETEEDEDNDNLVKQLQEMLESESGDIDLFRVDIL